MAEKLTKRILVAPLDWGLGHATRCIPIIRLLLSQNITVLVAAEGAIASLLKTEFPAIVILPLRGYRIQYSSGKKFFFFKMLLQLPKILLAIRNEKKWLNEIIVVQKINGVISDNRFGFHSKQISCAFITHQLNIQTGKKWLNKIAQKINYRFIKQFAELWIADVCGINNLSGKLSSPKKFPPVPTKYIGILSRFIKKEAGEKVDILFLISGPEPQRTILEKKFRKAVNFVEGNKVIVRGKPSEKNDISEGFPSKLKLYNHLPAEELNDLIESADIVIARCGYSTVMDLVALNKKAILIPTPGQSEQEYLATYLSEKKIFLTATQENFSLQNALLQFRNMQFEELGISTDMNERVILEWLQKCN